jgi:hypothetical protein
MMEEKSANKSSQQFARVCAGQYLRSVSTVGSDTTDSIATPEQWCGHRFECVECSIVT